MNKLTKADTYGENIYEQWQINKKELTKIKIEIERLYYKDPIIFEDDIEKVCIALYELGYLELKNER